MSIALSFCPIAATRVGFEKWAVVGRDWGATLGNLNNSATGIHALSIPTVSKTLFTVVDR